MNDEQIKRNRLWNFRQIIKTAGGTNEVARIMGKKNSYITAIAGPNPSRSIGNKMAQTIEQVFELGHGSLDLPPPKDAASEDEYIAHISATLANASETDKEFVLAVAQWIVGRSIKELPQDRSPLLLTAKDVLAAADS